MSVTACLCLIWEDRQGRFHGRRSVQQKRARGSSCRRDSNKLRNRKNRAALSSHLEKQVLADPRSFSSRSFCHPILPGLYLQTLFLTGQCPPGCPGDCSPASVSLEVRFSPAPWKSGSISKLECKGPSPWVGRGAGGGRSMGSPAPSPCSLFFFFFVFYVLFASVSPSAWPQLTTNIIPGSNKVIRPNSGPCRARPLAALTAVSVLLLKLAL